LLLWLFVKNEEYSIYLKKEINDHWHDTFGVGNDFYQLYFMGNLEA
jgi:hypothetical protein